MRNKGFAPIIILVLITLAVVGYIGYKYLQSTNQPFNQSTSPSPSPTPTPDPTANWKTYTDKGKEYSLKYPSQYFYQESGDGAAVVFDLQPFKDCSIQGRFDCLSANDRIPIFSVVKYSGSQSEYYKNDSYPYHLMSEGTTNVVGREYSQVIFTLKDSSPLNMPGLYYQSTDTIFPHGNSIVIVRYEKERKDSVNYQQIYSQILSTFKFMDKECKEGTVLKQCKLGPCCCPVGAICD